MGPRLKLSGEVAVGARIGIAFDCRSGVVIAGGLNASGAAVGAACQMIWNDSEAVSKQ
jgi:hypothetical protein